MNPFSRRSPIKRSKPLRTRRRHVPAAERWHMEKIASLPCLVCGTKPVTVHHVTASVEGGRLSRSNFRVVPLCARHHLYQHGPRESVEALGHAGFTATYGIDLLAEADRLWAETCDGA